MGAVDPVQFLPAALLAAVFVWYIRAAAVPPPPEQSAANCAAPSYASDQLVCADPALLALDRRMARLLAAAGSAAQASQLHWFEPQQVWFRRRSRCAFSERQAACLRAAYSERIALLSALDGPAAGQGRPALTAICTNAPWGNGPVRLYGSHASPLTIEDSRGRALVVAAPSSLGMTGGPFFTSSGKTRGSGWNLSRAARFAAGSFTISAQERWPRLGILHSEWPWHPPNGFRRRLQ
ncbi:MULTISPECIES: hypothetical protein [Aphanothece]|uniref:hypothetical protein n=1 Tax=Aphanothece TaxID=1121 RepID=UPI00398F782D